MDFSEALRAVKTGRRVARAGWNGAGMWIFLVPGSEIIVDPSRPIGQVAPELSGLRAVYRPHVDMWTADGEFVPWQATQSDLLADDWEVVTHA